MQRRIDRKRVFMYWYFFLQMCFMWCETTSGMSPFMSFVEGTHLHQRLHRSKTFCNKVPLVLKQASLSTGRAVVFYLEDFLAFLHVKSNPLQGSLSSLNILSKSLVLTIGTFCNFSPMISSYWTNTVLEENFPRNFISKTFPPTSNAHTVTLLFQNEDEIKTF